MNYMWNPEMQDVLDAQELARSRGKVAGQDYTTEFLEIMKKRNKKPFGANEFNKEELINHLTEKSGKLLKINTDDKGVQTFEIYKKEKE
jgi:hypothetical protein